MRLGQRCSIERKAVQHRQRCAVGHVEIRAQRHAVQGAVGCHQDAAPPVAVTVPPRIVPPARFQFPVVASRANVPMPVPVTLGPATFAGRVGVAGRNNALAETTWCGVVALCHNEVRPGRSR